jgi:hypothetical protein
MRSSILLAASSAILAVASPILQERGRTIVKTETATEWVVVTVTDGIPLPSMFRPDRNRVFPSSITSFSSASPSPTPAPEPSPEPAPAPAPEPEPAPPAPPVEVPPFVPPAFVEAPQPQPPAPAPPAPAPVQQAPAGDDYVSTVLFHHNVHRSNHSSGDLSWGSNYADYAMQTARKCKFEHDLAPGGGGYGQNLAMYATSSGAQAFGANRAGAQAASDFWYNGELYKFPGYGQDTPDMGNFRAWGHFSQLVWTNTQQVGCASYLCPAGTIVGNMDSWFTVCNYFPAGNVKGAYADNVKAPSGHPTVQAS